jgi:hypothetical protein
LLLMKPPPVDGRKMTSATILQSAITEAVKRYDPGCEFFAGVLVERTSSRSRSTQIGPSEKQSAEKPIATNAAKRSDNP